MVDEQDDDDDSWGIWSTYKGRCRLLLSIQILHYSMKPLKLCMFGGGKKTLNVTKAFILWFLNRFSMEERKFFSLFLFANPPYQLVCSLHIYIWRFYLTRMRHHTLNMPSTENQSLTPWISTPVEENNFGSFIFWFYFFALSTLLYWFSIILLYSKVIHR